MESTTLAGTEFSGEDLQNYIKNIYSTKLEMQQIHINAVSVLANNSSEGIALKNQGHNIH